MELSLGAVRLRSRLPLDAATEETLIERCRKHDYEAFGKLVDAYQNRVYGFVKRMLPNPDEAQDVTQEVFIRAFQNVNRFDGRSGMRTWLFRIAHNLCIDHARRAGRHVSEVGMVDSEEGETYDVADTRWQPDRLYMTEELSVVVERAIASMSEKLRSVLLLHDREDMQYEEIAQLLGVPIGTVKSRLFLAREHLQKTLRPYLGEDVARS